jgi:hypothetical protein
MALLSGAAPLLLRLLSERDVPTQCAKELVIIQRMRYTRSELPRPSLKKLNTQIEYHFLLPIPTV